MITTCTCKCKNFFRTIFSIFTVFSGPSDDEICILCLYQFFRWYKLTTKIQLLYTNASTITDLLAGYLVNPSVLNTSFMWWHLHSVLPGHDSTAWRSNYTSWFIHESKETGKIFLCKTSLICHFRHQVWFYSIAFQFETTSRYVDKLILQ